MFHAIFDSSYVDILDLFGCCILVELLQSLPVGLYLIRVFFSFVNLTHGLYLIRFCFCFLSWTVFVFSEFVCFFLNLHKSLPRSLSSIGIGIRYWYCKKNALLKFLPRSLSYQVLFLLSKCCNQ